MSTQIKTVLHGTYTDDNKENGLAMRENWKSSRELEQGVWRELPCYIGVQGRAR